MGLDELSGLQQQQLHPLIKLKRKTSQEALGSLVELLGDVSRLYQEFAQGLHQLELKASSCSFLAGVSNPSSLEALRHVRSDGATSEDTVLHITREQKGMATVWTTLFSMLSRARKETTEYATLLGHSVLDPVSMLCDEFNDVLNEPVDRLEMNDVLNFIPNLKTLKQAPGFNHCGARKYVENVLKAFKDLQSSLENEKEVIGEAAALNDGKSQAKAVNKTVKAKISLGKHIQHLFEVAPDMKVLITKGVSQETIEQLATLKLKKAASIMEEVHTDPVEFHSRFCELEKRRLSMLSSCLQIWVEALVNYERNSYNNIRAFYQAIVDFSPESDYGQFEALIMGARVSHVATHSRMVDEIWLPKELEPLEEFKAGRQSNVCLILHQPTAPGEFEDETETVIGDDPMAASNDAQTLAAGVMGIGGAVPVGLIAPTHSLFATTCCVNAADVELQNGSETQSLPENVSISTHGISDEVDQLSMTIDELSENSACSSTRIISDNEVPEAPDAANGISCGQVGIVGADGVLNTPQTGSYQAGASNILNDSGGMSALFSGTLRSQTNMVERNAGQGARVGSIAKVVETHSVPDHTPVLRSRFGSLRGSRQHAVRRSSSALPCEVRNLSIPLYKEEKRDKKKDRDELSETKEERKECKDDKSHHEKKRGKGLGKAPNAYMVNNISYDGGHFSKNPEEPSKGAITFDFETFKTAKEILQGTLQRANSYFLGLHRSYVSANTPFNFRVDDFNGLVDEIEDQSQYPLEMSAPISRPANKSGAAKAEPAGVKSVRNFGGHDANRLLRFVCKFEDANMDTHQWNRVALESLLLLHKHLSSFMTHPCLSSDANTTLRDFLLTNMGVIEHLVARIRNFIDVFKSRLKISGQEFSVVDALVTPRDAFVSTSPQIMIHPMDVRYRLLLLIDSWHKNDILIGNELLFDIPECQNFLHRQLFVIKLSMAQKLARVVRRIPAFDGSVDSRWAAVLESETPMKTLDLKFTFEGNPKAERTANKILFLLCECIGQLNSLRRVVDQGQWGEESVCDSNYMGSHDKLVQMLHMTSQLEDLDGELMSLVTEQTRKESSESLEKASSSASITSPVNIPQNGPPTQGPPSQSSGRSSGPAGSVASPPPAARNISMRNAADYFCTSMDIFQDEDISVLKRLDARKGCFNRCMVRRGRRNAETADVLVNPYFIDPSLGVTLSRCWKLEDSVILRIAALYHQAFAENLRLGEWSMNFTTIEYVIYFMSTGGLLNFLLYKDKHNADYTSICTLFHAVLSVAGMWNTYADSKKARKATDAKNGRSQASLNIIGSVNNADEKAKDVFAILQVPHNLAVMPKVISDIDLYLQMDVREAVAYFMKQPVHYDAPEYSSLQLSGFLETHNQQDRLSEIKLQFAGMQLNRAGYKVHRLVLDSTRQNIPMMTILKNDDALSLINTSPCEQLVSSLLILRVLTNDLRKMLFRQLLEFTADEGAGVLAYKLSSFVLIHRLLFRNDLEADTGDAGPLDSHSQLEACDGKMNMDSLLRSVILAHAKAVVEGEFAKFEAFEINDIDTLAATVMDNLTTLIKDHMVFTSVWDDFLPMGDFASLFTNACIHFFKMNVRQRLSRPLDVCKVMPSAHKLRLLQREIETSRLVKTNSETQQDELLQLLKFSFASSGAVGRDLLAESCDIMEVIGMGELEARLGSFKDIVTRGMNNENWERIASKNHTRAVVDMATVLNATFNATLDLKTPLENICVPLTGALESVLNHYFVLLVGAKVPEHVEHALTSLRDETGSGVEGTLKKIGANCDTERSLLHMANVLYLGECLSDFQDNMVECYHRLLTERYEASEELHRQLETDFYRDSQKFFSFDIDIFRSMKELALLPASKRLIRRQCQGHVQTIARLCALKTLYPTCHRLYRPSVASGARVSEVLEAIKGICSEFCKLGDSSRPALYAVFEVAFYGLMSAIRAARWHREEAGLLKEDIKALEGVALFHEQDVSQLVASVSELLFDDDGPGIPPENPGPAEDVAGESRDGVYRLSLNLRRCGVAKLPSPSCLAALLEVLTAKPLRAIRLDESLEVDGYLWNFVVLQLLQADYNGDITRELKEWPFYRDKAKFLASAGAPIQEVYIYNAMRDIPTIVYCRNKKKFLRESVPSSTSHVAEIRYELVLEKSRSEFMRIATVDAVSHVSKGEQTVIGTIGIDKKGGISLKGTLSELQLCISDDTVIKSGVYCAGSTVIVEGIMEPYKESLRCISISHPPLAAKMDLPDFFGGNVTRQEQSALELRMAHQVECGGTEQWVIISDIHFDNDATLEAFETLLDSESLIV
ncbi:DNA polymerase epsilon subunit 2 [Babesia caballi]|uniref:DNA polymerase epsilon subunit 2 n=1 Tax=Babesia caballi TaxID=5871 RepID=A0AAV4LW09_BABCB|nr:DNA polymerase epsilon subunit 2 [Babesia caballi]